jgi:integrase/recombinase XerD
MVQIVRKTALPSPSEVPESLRAAATLAPTMRLREPRPTGFPLLFTTKMELIEPAVEFLHEHAVRRAHTPDTVRTYAEILYDWFDTLEQSGVDWTFADAADLIAYRNRMLSEASGHTKRRYAIRTINHRVRGVLRFYEWAVRSGWMQSSELTGRSSDFAIARRGRALPAVVRDDSADTNIFVLRQYTSLPRPFAPAELRELLATLLPPYDLMARWQLYTGLRVSELLRVTVADISKAMRAINIGSAKEYAAVEVLRKGRKNGYVIASRSLLEETVGYVSTHRRAWLARAARRRRRAEDSKLFVNSRGRPVTQNWYQHVIRRAGLTCGFVAMTHLLRATFACMMLARLEQLAKADAAINPLLIVKVLMGHEHIDTTDRYLRAVAVEPCVVSEALGSLLEKSQD